MSDSDRTVELRLRAAVESSPSGLLMVDERGTIVLVNREIERLFGYSREDILGRSVDVLVPEQGRAAHGGFRSAFLARPSVRAMGAGRDLYGRTSDGREVPVEIGLTPVATAEGLFVLASIVDISERRRADERFRRAVESSPNGMVMVDAEGKIVLVNREIERMFGYARSEILGKGIEMLVPERFRSRHPGYRATFFATPRSRAMGAGRDLTGLCKDGSEIAVEIGLNPIETEDGLFVLSSIVDISARKQAEEEQRQLQAQLRHLQKMEAVGTLAGGMAHDFNNLLAVIIGCAELIRDDLVSESSRRDLADLLDAAARGREIVSRVLAFSRRPAVTRLPLALGDAVAEATKHLGTTLPPGIQVQVSCDPAAPRVLADATAVHQVIMNLGSNAAQAMPTGGEIRVSVDAFYVHDSIARSLPGLREGRYTRVLVRDTGHGIDPTIHDRVFEPFFTTKRAGAGTGLGLAMVHGIMLEHDGFVDIESEPGAGTTVRCLFPAMEGTWDDVGDGPAPPVIRGAGQRILLVEDEPALLRTTQRQLERLGYTVEAYTRGTDAVAAFTRSPDAFAAVITDYSMPGMTGLELGQAFVQVHPDIPILLVTGRMEEIDDAVLAHAGIRGVGLKPLTLERLAALVSTVVLPQ